MVIKVSVIVPVYNPGERILRVVRSLDRQTLPQEEFEVVFVDDGSTDGSGDRLHRLAAQRPNLRVASQPNSGWPSWPRNLGIGLARGDYVLFLDHDDELGDDALHRLHAYAVAHGSDVVVGKEYAIGRSALDSPMWRHNVPRASVVDDRLLDLLTAHRLFRRELLLTHDIRFPERVGLLEDQPFALKAYLRADVVSVLADYPVYAWMVEEGNSSRGPARPDTYLANIRECLDLVEAHIDPGPERDAMLLRWLQASIAGSVGPRLLRRNEETWAPWLADVQAVLAERFPPHLDALAPPMHRLRIAAARAGDLPAVLALAEFELGSSASGTALDFDWQDGALQVRAEGVLLDGTGRPMAFECDGDRVFRRLPEPVAGYTEDGCVDLTGAVAAASGELKLRHRDRRYEWYLPGRSAARLEERDGRLALVVQCTTTVDPAVAALGAPLERGVWDTVFWLRALGYDLRPRLSSPPAPTRPALVDGVPVIAYRTQNERLALDVGGTVRTVVGSARPRPADATVAYGPEGTRLSVALPRVHVRGPAALPGSLSLGAAILEGAVALPAELVADEHGARLESWLTALPGRYDLRATFGGPTTSPLLVLEAGLDASMTLGRHVAPPAEPPSAAAVRAARSARPRAAPRPTQRERTALTFRAALVNAREAVRRSSRRRTR